MDKDPCLLVWKSYQNCKKQHSKKNCDNQLLHFNICRNNDMNKNKNKHKHNVQSLKN